MRKVLRLLKLEFRLVRVIYSRGNKIRTCVLDKMIFKLFLEQYIDFWQRGVGKKRKVHWPTVQMAQEMWEHGPRTLARGSLS